MELYLYYLSRVIANVIQNDSILKSLSTHKVFLLNLDV